MSDDMWANCSAAQRKCQPYTGEGESVAQLINVTFNIFMLLKLFLSEQVWQPELVIKWCDIFQRPADVDTQSVMSFPVLCFVCVSHDNTMASYMWVTSFWFDFAGNWFSNVNKKKVNLRNWHLNYFIEQVCSGNYLYEMHFNTFINQLMDLDPKIASHICKYAIW